MFGGFDIKSKHGKRDIYSPSFESYKIPFTSKMFLIVAASAEPYRKANLVEGFDYLVTISSLCVCDLVGRILAPENSCFEAL